MVTAKQGALAGLASSAALATLFIAIRLIQPPWPPADVSDGMAAFGEVSRFLFEATVVGLPLVAAALFTLRAWPRAWTVVCTAAVLGALTGPAAVLIVMLTPHDSPTAGLAAFFFLRALAAPLGMLVLAVLTVMAPSGGHRKAMLVATALELATAAWLVLHFAVGLAG
ncbi:MAG: hypothetical protein JNG84_04695 [Archangium sp.]|nr:hypothetical protein [Archangium sp.]